jgi:ABC transport system ATP-binding/permease protein
MLEADIEKLEKEKADIEDALSGGELPADKLHEYSKRHAEISGELETKSDRWLELSELNG